MLPVGLQTRKRELQQALLQLSGSPEIVIGKQLQRNDGELVVEFEHSVRVKTTGLRLLLWEQFRDIDSDPRLYAFCYTLTDATDVQSKAPIFRYECHPKTSDAVGKNAAASEIEVFQSPYGREPHFHPDRASLERIRKLHFPFHRSERKAVVFALIQWLRVDLVQRFYEKPLVESR